MRFGVDHIAGVTHVHEAAIEAVLQPALAQAVVGAAHLRTGHLAREFDVGHLRRRGRGQSGDVVHVHVAVGLVDHPHLLLVGRERDAVTWRAGPWLAGGVREFTRR